MITTIETNFSFSEVHFLEHFLKDQTRKPRTAIKLTETKDGTYASVLNFKFEPEVSRCLVDGDARLLVTFRESTNLHTVHALLFNSTAYLHFKLSKILGTTLRLAMPSDRLPKKYFDYMRS